MSKIYDEFYNEEATERKEKPKVVSKKTNKKSNHRHKYEPVLFVNTYGKDEDKLFYTAGNECTICNKLSHGWNKDLQKELQEFAIKYKDDFSIDLIKTFGQQKELREVRIQSASGLDLATASGLSIDEVVKALVTR